MALSADDDASTNETDDNIGMLRSRPPTSAGPTADTLTYTLAARDAAMFRVRQDDPAY